MPPVVVWGSRLARLSACQSGDRAQLLPLLEQAGCHWSSFAPFLFRRLRHALDRSRARPGSCCRDSLLHGGPIALEGNRDVRMKRAGASS